MDPAVQAAIIGVSGSMLVAVVGILGVLTAARWSANATRQASAQANAAALETARLAVAAEQQRRMWDKRAEVYVDLIVVTDHANLIGSLRVDTGQNDSASQKRVNEWIKSLEGPDHWKLSARVRAFASDAVFEAYEAHAIAQADFAAAQATVDRIPTGTADREYVRAHLNLVRSRGEVLVRTIRAELRPREA